MNRFKQFISESATATLKNKTEKSNIVNMGEDEYKSEVARRLAENVHQVLEAKVKK